jgi:hypothetical protein
MVEQRKLTQPRRYKGGSVSLTAFEAAWLRMHLDTTPDEALDALPHIAMPIPRRIKSDPSAAWDRIVQKVADVAPVNWLDTTVGRAALNQEDAK